MSNDPASGPTPGHPALTPQVPNSAEHSRRKTISNCIEAIFNRIVDTFIDTYPWIGALLAVGCVIVGFFQPLTFTAAIVTSIGALAILLGSILQAFAAYVGLVASSHASQSRTGRFLSSFIYDLTILTYQYHGWVLVLGGGIFLLAGAVMAAIALA